MTEPLILKTVDHPEANGRKPRHGEQEWILQFPLEDGRHLHLRIGAKCFEAHTDMLMDMLAERPSHTDGIPTDPTPPTGNREP